MVETRERAGGSIYPTKKFGGQNKKTIEKNFFVFSFLVVPVVLFLIFYVYVNANSFLMAFRREGMRGDRLVEYWTFENFQKIGDSFSSAGGVLAEALINTMLFNAVNLLLVLPVTTLMCYFIVRKIHGYRFFRAVMYVPCIITSSALVVLFKIALDNGGPLDILFGKMGYTYPLTSSPNAIITILTYNFLFGLGGNIIVIGGAFNAIDPQMLEAGQIDGANWIQEFFYIMLPSIWPTISTVLILSAAGFLGATGPILAFTQGSNGTMTLAFYTFALISGTGTTQDLYLASAIGLCMTVVSFPFALIVKRIVYGKEK